MALAVPLSRFTPRVGGGSAFYVRPHESYKQKHYQMKMKTFFPTVCVVLLAMASFADISKPSQPLEIVLIFKLTESYPTNPPTTSPFRQFTQILFRNVGEKTINDGEMLSGLSIVWDGKEYKNDPKHKYGRSDGPPFGPGSSFEIPFSPFDFLIPQDALTPGWHTVSAKAGNAESNRVSLRILKRILK
jgi:hypothetical protein